MEHHGDAIDVFTEQRKQYHEQEEDDDDDDLTETVHKTKRGNTLDSS